MKTTVIGLTGPTGAGKGCVSAVFAAHGAQIIDADRVAREVTEPGSEALDELAAEFSQDIINQDGTLNRAVLAERAFATDKGKQRLNQITHPHIMRMVQSRIDAMRTSGAEMIVFDAPLLFESGGEGLCDAVVCVIAPPDMRRKRIMLRDGISLQQADQRMNAQPDDDFYTSKSDYVIVNSGDVGDLQKSAERVLQSIRGQ